MNAALRLRALKRKRHKDYYSLCLFDSLLKQCFTLSQTSSQYYFAHSSFEEDKSLAQDEQH